MKKVLWKGGCIAVFAAAVAVLPAFGTGQPTRAVAAEEAATVEEVTFSHKSGVYDSGFSLELTAAEGTTIYYTTDGSNPTSSEGSEHAQRFQYTGPITITDRKEDANVLSAVDPAKFDSAYADWDSKNQTFNNSLSSKMPSNADVDKITVIKAAAMDSAGNYSAVVTNSYFIGSMADHISGIKESCEASGLDLSIMSISMNYDDLFDAEKGIYVHGNIFDEALKEYLASGKRITSQNAIDVARELDANYKQKGKTWERAAHIDYFESNGENTAVKLQQDCGIRIQGNYSRSDYQKSFRLYAREDYGKKNFKYAFFKDSTKNDNGEPVDKYKKLNLRNGGNCAFLGKYNDAYWQSLIRDLKCETQGTRVCVVYLNGEYWGIYALQEDYDDNYFEETHGVVKDDVVLYKGDAEALALGYELDEGSLPDGEEDESYYFHELLDFFKSHNDLSKQEDYEAFCKLVDAESARDYFAVQIWINNKWDWPGKNWSVWKTTNTDETNPYADGRWRFCFYDMDFGGVSGAGEALTNTIKEDNYKDYGLLDKRTDNPVVLIYSYLMTNKGFREDFENSLSGLSQKNFEKNTAIAGLDVFKGTWEPLLDQFFNRFSHVSTAHDAIYGYYGTYNCLKAFLEKRPGGIPGMIQWVNDYFANAESGYSKAIWNAADGVDHELTVENNSASLTIQGTWGVIENLGFFNDNTSTKEFTSDVSLTVNGQYTFTNIGSGLTCAREYANGLPNKWSTSALPLASNVANAVLAASEGGIVLQVDGKDTTITSLTYNFTFSGWLAPAPGGNATPAPGGNATPAPGGSNTPAPGGSSTPAPGGSSTPAPGGSSTPAPGGNGTSTPGGNGTSTPQNNSSVKKKKIKKLQVTAKKGTKKIKISTLKKSKVTIQINRKILRKGKKSVKKITYSAKKNKKGSIVLKLSQKLKKKDKITVIVSKDGYAKKKKTVKIK